MQKVKIFLILRDMWTSGDRGVKIAMIAGGAGLLLGIVGMGYGAGLLEFLGG